LQNPEVENLSSGFRRIQILLSTRPRKKVV